MDLEITMRIILSTRNQSKIVQIAPLFSGLPLVVASLADAGIEGEAVEDGTTLGENALKKARFAREKTGEWAMADDTGIFIDALGGAPGIHSARWAGEGKSAEEILAFVLAELSGVSLPRRTATFRTVAALVSPEGEETVFSGSVQGVLLERPRVPCQPQMPYSGIFLLSEFQKVWAEMRTEEENAMSHRGKAFRAAREYLETNLV